MAFQADWDEVQRQNIELMKALGIDNLGCREITLNFKMDVTPSATVNFLLDEKQLEKLSQLIKDGKIKVEVKANQIEISHDHVDANRMVLQAIKSVQSKPVVLENDINKIHEGKLCEVCNGHGLVPAKVRPYKDVCGACQGKGWNPDRVGEPRAKSTLEAIREAAAKRLSEHIKKQILDPVEIPLPLNQKDIKLELPERKTIAPGPEPTLDHNHIIIIDDPVQPKELSPMLTKVYRSFLEKIYQTLGVPKKVYMGVDQAAEDETPLEPSAGGYCNACGGEHGEHKRGCPVNSDD